VREEQTIQMTSPRESSTFFVVCVGWVCCQDEFERSIT